MADLIINTANTLSFFSNIAQDKRFPITSSQSVFTFGDFRIDRGNIFDNLEFPSSAVSFSNFSTLQNFSSATPNPVTFVTTENELNPDVRDPNAYSYFGSFYTKVSRAINSVIASFPYAILVNTNGSANTVFGYTHDDYNQVSSFKIATSALTNQGNVIYSSGVTDTTVTTLFNNFNVFGIQFSATTTATTEIFDITNFQYTTGTTGYLQFDIKGLLFTGTTSASTTPIYIRPSAHNYSQYQRTISNLEFQLAFDGTFKVPDNDNETVFVYQNIPWPRTIDGFNIDSYGDNFNAYMTSILDVATRIDETKTSWMVRAMIPEQFIELDTDTQIYQKLISVYGEEFDTIKSYIDNLAFMHTVDYDRLESVPDKFMYKLSRLLAFDYHDAFSSVDMFEYLLTEDQDGKTLQDYNLELWRKMLINIVWLYKKKGTRDAIMFLFKIMGAPDSLICLNEFAYKVSNVNAVDTSTMVQTVNASQEIASFTQDKISSDGYINYNSSNFVFQEGGTNQGNGQKYIDQWSPEFTLDRYVDNIKATTGDTVFGTRNILNSKELQIALSPAQAIEVDVFQWFQLGFGIWNWGSTGMTVSPFSFLAFSGMSVPFEWTPDPSSLFAIMPPDITGMTISQWLDYIYASNVNPTNRKTTNAYSSNMSEYISLKKIYMTYMLWTNSQESNRLTFAKLERLLELLERDFFQYLMDFVPVTSILENSGALYRNTIFERQKFVYPAGINDGSEFQVKLPDEIDEVIPGYSLTAVANNNINPQLEGFSIQAITNSNIEPQVEAFTIASDIQPPISPISNGFTMNANFFPEIEKDFTMSEQFTATTISYTSGNTIVPFFGSIVFPLSDYILNAINLGTTGIDDIL